MIYNKRGKKIFITSQKEKKKIISQKLSVYLTYSYYSQKSTFEKGGKCKTSLNIKRQLHI